MLIGERRINMMRYFNERNGFSKSDDYLPERVFKAMPEGPSEGVILKKDEFYKAIDKYYKIAGWNPETGNPTEGSLRKLSLGWLLKSRGTQ
jgi:aldehyde:ferredoxin oxidoreductase